MTVRSTVRCPLSPSLTEGELIDRLGAASSSVMVNVTLRGCPTPALDVPDTRIVLSGASVPSFTAVTVTAPVLVVAPAAMVSAVLALNVAPASAGTDTVTVVGTLRIRFSVAVTVVTLPVPLSAIVAGVSRNAATRSSSLLSTVSVTALALPS